jgi:NhaA family Na+:H+ antiporter
MLVPVRAKMHPREFLQTTEERLSQLRETRLTSDSMIEARWQLDAISDLRRAASEMRPPGLALEETFHHFVAFVVLPLFAFFNAGVAINGSFVDGLKQPVVLGVILGLVIGKQVGIFAFSWLAVKLGGAEQPEGVYWSHIYGGSAIAGIGFTMSLFVTELAFREPANLTAAKMGVLMASLAAAGWGAVALHLVLPPHPGPRAARDGGRA